MACPSLLGLSKIALRRSRISLDTVLTARFCSPPGTEFMSQSMRYTSLYSYGRMRSLSDVALDSKYSKRQPRRLLRSSPLISKPGLRPPRICVSPTGTQALHLFPPMRSSSLKKSKSSITMELKSLSEIPFFGTTSTPSILPSKVTPTTNLGEQQSGIQMPTGKRTFRA